MKNSFYKFVLCVVSLVASSCNMDGVITTEIPEGGKGLNANCRPSTGQSRAEWSRVYEYTPAPGQFINDTRTAGFDGTQTTASAAVAYAEQRLSAGLFVSLGGFGGYLVVGFDHSVKNVSGYDFAVIGNAFDGSSEPAVVWVMQDENCDGKPNDVWYELRGSESGNESTIQNYSVTYHRPTAAGEPVPWSDSLGDSGEVDYLAAYHSQESYYPLWIAEDSYTLCGTRLEARNYDSSGNGSLWIQPSYGWGYADNFSSEDFVSTDKSNRFDISNAVTDTGNRAGLEYIDFVKVQCAINSKSGWLGEVSTEVVGFRDLNIE